MFETIVKWWCQCIDQCFQIVARPSWKDEELPYRRMLAGIYQIPWSIPRAHKEFTAWRTSRNLSLSKWSETRDALREFTAEFWAHNGKFMTPSWPDGTTEIIEEIFVEQTRNFGDETVMAIRMLYGLGCDRVQKHLIGQALGITDRAEIEKLYDSMWKSERFYQGCLKHHPHIRLFQEARYQLELNAFYFRWKDEKAKKLAKEIQRLERIAIETLPVELLDRKLDGDMDLSVRAFNACYAAQTLTVRSLLEMTEKEFLQKGRTGRKVLNDINELLKSFNERLHIGVLTPVATE